MTQEEQQQVSAMRDAYEQTIRALARQDADRAQVVEVLAIRLKAAEERLKALEPSNVVPIGDAP